MTSAPLLPGERQKIILDRIERKGRVIAADLAAEFETSEDTIRRDLRDLAAAGLVRRVYGGALPLSPASGTLAERSAEAPERKAALGLATAQLVEAGQVVFIDAGSTNLAVARALPAGLGITVVTNAPSIAAELTGRAGIELMLIGGRVDPRTGSAIGARALRDLADMRVDLACLGACAVDAEDGVATFCPEEAELKRAVAERARAVVIAMTTEKLATTAPFFVLPIDRLTHLVVEADAPDAELERISAAGTDIHRARIVPGP
ncbi:MAG: DeoR/GlpR family DNA-binding transcription regulator [Ancalomicrobiaceae bacterium]|nr:DeoR/GlpR family DNA-binding transcription regulator [Ancalomicrobiaceae bacterium]